MAEHFSPDTVARYRGGRLMPDELLAVDDHLAACEDCRERTRATLDADARTARLFDVIARGRSNHTGYEILEAYVDGRLESTESEFIDAHLQGCAQCREDLGDLRRARALLQSETEPVPDTPGMAGLLLGLWRSGPVRLVAGLAAGAAALWLVLSPGLREAAPSRPSQAANGSTREREATAPRAADDGRAAVVATINDGPGVVVLTSTGELTGLPNLPNTVREAVVTALTTGRVGVVATSVAGASGVLRGPVQESTFDVVAPVGVVVETERPTFRWTALPGARSYHVALFDSSFREVAASGPLSATHWVPPASLPRGTTYVWQVTALTEAGEITAPAPPAPEARFAVLDESRAADLERLRQIAPDSHLALAVAYAQAGMRAEAIRELGVLARRNPDSALVRDLLTSVQTPR